MTYALEYIQTDPEGSPTPGSGHHAGTRMFRTLTMARAHGRRAVGRPVPADYWWPCCEWQDRATPVTGWRIVELDDDGNEGREYLP